MQKHNLAAQPIELQEFAVAENAVVEVQPAENWVQEEHKLRNQQNEVENFQERVQRLVPGLDLRKVYL